MPNIILSKTIHDAQNNNVMRSMEINNKPGLLHELMQHIYVNNVLATKLASEQSSHSLNMQESYIFTYSEGETNIQILHLQLSSKLQML